MCENRDVSRRLGFTPFVMSLTTNSTPQVFPAAMPGATVVRVTHEARSVAVLVAELDGTQSRDWEAARNQAFLEAFRGGTAPNSVVLVSPHTLPRRAGGAVEEAVVIQDFARRRGYLKDEIQAWIVTRLCEVLYLVPGQIDPTLDWARHGVDSAVALELLADLEDRLRVRLPQALAESRNPVELASEATLRLTDREDSLPWWRSPWVTAGGA